MGSGLSLGCALAAGLLLAGGAAGCGSDGASGNAAGGDGGVGGGGGRISTGPGSSSRGNGGESSAGGSGGEAGGGAGGSSSVGVTIEGHELLKDGTPFQIRGVNRSGTEYACVQGNGIFDGPSDDASLDAIAAWHANAVRVPLNETCWLAINGLSGQSVGAPYQQAIKDYLGRIEAHGLVPILELHWSAAGDAQATKQDPMPNRDHSVDFWSQVAGAFKSDPYVVFELFNEPFPDSNQDTEAAWTCWRDGGDCPGADYQVAGMQELVTAVRGAGAGNAILLGGVEYSNALGGWLAHMPTDPLHHLGAAWHVYNFNGCSSSSCYDGAAAAVADAVPIVATEIGEDDCGGSFITEIMGWLDGRGLGYLAWTWDTWGINLVLITDYDGTPNCTYGQTYKDHLASP